MIYIYLRESFIYLPHDLCPFVRGGLSGISAKAAVKVKPYGIVRFSCHQKIDKILWCLLIIKRCVNSIFSKLCEDLNAVFPLKLYGFFNAFCCPNRERYKR